MSLSGEVYIKTPSPYSDQVTLGYYSSQSESLVYDGSEELSPLGTIVPLFNSVRRAWSLSNSTPLTGAEYRQLLNTIQALHGGVYEINIDTEGGDILGTVRITGSRQVWHKDSNDYYVVSAEITQGY